MQTHTATDLMTWVSEQLLAHEDWRRDLPLLAAPDVQADAVDGMRKRLAELLDDPTLLARYRAAMDGQPAPHGPRVRRHPRMPCASTPSPGCAADSPRHPVPYAPRRRSGCLANLPPRHGPRAAGLHPSEPGPPGPKGHPA
nr:cupin domain-containing protein [Streptomyces sp. 1222.5]